MSVHLTTGQRPRLAHIHRYETLPNHLWMWQTTDHERYKNVVDTGPLTKSEGGMRWKTRDAIGWRLNRLWNAKNWQWTCCIDDNRWHAGSFITYSMTSAVCQQLLVNSRAVQQAYNTFMSNSNNNSNTNSKKMFMVLSSWQSHCESSPAVHLMNVEWRQAAAHPRPSQTT